VLKHALELASVLILRLVAVLIIVIYTIFLSNLEIFFMMFWFFKVT
jgi:hypothetical protein